MPNKPNRRSIQFAARKKLGRLKLYDDDPPGKFCSRQPSHTEQLACSFFFILIRPQLMKKTKKKWSCWRKYLHDDDAIKPAMRNRCVGGHRQRFTAFDTYRGREKANCTARIRQKKTKSHTSAAY